MLKYPYNALKTLAPRLPSRPVPVPRRSFTTSHYRYRTLPNPIMASTAAPSEWANHPLFSGLPPLPAVKGAEPTRIALDAFKTAVAVQCHQILNLFPDEKDPADSLRKVWEGVESGKKDADLQVAVPRFRLKGDPKAFAKKLADEFQPNDYIKGAKANGGFVAFDIRPETMARLVLNQINDLTHLASPSSDSSASPAKPVRTGYGTNTSGISPETGKPQKLVLEFSSPNIAKKFHAGHLRSTIIGAFLGNLYEANGWDVTRINYLGDWGRQFGVLAVGFAKHGTEEKLKSEPIQHLLDVYTAINRDMDADPTAKAEIEQAARDFFKRMEDGEPTALAQWKLFRDYSITQYEADYARLNIQFDVYSGESQVTHESMNKALETLIKQNVAVDDKGTLICDLEKYKLGKTVIRKSDGTNLYITRDIGEAIQRWDQYHFDKMIYVVASQQDLHLAQFFKVLSLMNYPWASKLLHINFGMVAGMSTRKGTSVHLEDMMDEAKNTMWEQMKKNDEKYRQIIDPERTADEVGITGIKIQDMAGKRVNGYEFKWERVLSFEGDTGPYLQYAHVRLCSVERKVANEITLPPPSEISTINTALLTSDAKAVELILLLAQYPDAVKFAFTKLEPSAIVTYCWKLTHAVSSAWETLIVKGQEKDVALARLLLFRCCRDVLASAMKLLTLAPLDRM